MRGLLVVAATLCGCSTVIGADFGTYRVAGQADESVPDGALGNGGRAYWEPPGSGGAEEFGAGGASVVQEDSGTPGAGGAMVGSGGAPKDAGDAPGNGGAADTCWAPACGNMCPFGSHKCCAGSMCACCQPVPVDSGIGFDCPSGCACSGLVGDASCTESGFPGLHYVYCQTLSASGKRPTDGGACQALGAAWCCP
jgi:hypothetical protein